MSRDIGTHSVCSFGVPVEVFWHDCRDGDHLAAAVEALLQAIDGPDRLKNRYLTAMARAEFEDRLQVAQRGGLRPADHVKRIESVPSVDMFEIRWSGIPVIERDESGQERRFKVQVRLYYVDLPDGRLGVLACHAHEKCTRGDSQTIRDAQDREIAHAVEVYSAGFSDGWGLAELQSAAILRGRAART